MTFRPLAGTCSRIGQEKYAEMLTHKLLRDPKEVVEHIISVKEVRVYIRTKTEISVFDILEGNFRAQSILCSGHRLCQGFGEPRHSIPSKKMRLTLTVLFTIHR
jgi:hypothetical protein